MIAWLSAARFARGTVLLAFYFCAKRFNTEFLKRVVSFSVANFHSTNLRSASEGDLHITSVNREVGKLVLHR